MTLSRTTLLLACLTLISALARPALADPLPGQVLKFQQLPLNNGLAPSVGGQVFPGHDEWSTAYDVVPSSGTYRGTFMADDFADNYSTPVVHVKWWGSYDQNIKGNAGVQKFLIAFESDQPVDAAHPFSQPNQLLQYEIVTPGAITQNSGTFTETLINGNVNEHLFQYNAELKVPFNEQKDTVYWLKIVALVDPTTDGQLLWGWHNRDWGIQNTLASPNVTPGEGNIGPVINSNGTPDPVWHFQDDAVSGQIIVAPSTVPNQPYTITQFGFAPENYDYLPGSLISTDGPFGIQNFSEDLAFELYTVPEPSSIVLLGLGTLGMAYCVRRKRSKA